VRLEAREGTIYYTTDGSDPRRPFEGTVSSGAREYTGAPIPLGGATRLKARAFLEGEWSALNEAAFYVRQDWSGLQMTEIMYHPGSEELLEDEALFEFIELKNTKDTRLDLSGLSFTDGIQFTFPLGAMLDPGRFVVLASDKNAFTRLYGFEPFGAYRGRLDNGGERIRLTIPGGDVVLDVAYGDSRPWPSGADGGGRSLVRRAWDPQESPSQPLSWTVSGRRGGSPGTDEPF
jgi:hypothetical protein